MSLFPAISGKDSVPWLRSRFRPSFPERDSRHEADSPITSWASSYDDPSAMAQAWSQGQWELCHLGNGRFAGRLQSVLTASLRLGLHSFAPGVFSRGRLDPDLVFLAVEASGRARVNYRGRLLAENEVMALAPGEELGFHVQEPCQLFTVAVSRTCLEHHVRGFGEGAALDRLSFVAEAGVDRLALSAPASRVSVCGELGRILRSGCEAPADHRSESHARLLEQRVLTALTSDVAVGCAQHEPTLSDKCQAVRRAEAYLLEHLDWPVTVREICEAAGVCVRTLELGFLEVFGMSPKAYITVLRLNGIRRDMLKAEPGALVSDYAAKWGFFHFSRFAADYRRFFGESPSETLARIAVAS